MIHIAQIYPILASLSWLKVPVMILFVMSGIVLILVVLVQATKSGGLAGAFGMGGDTSVLGTRAGTFLGKVTTAVATVFLLLALIYALLLHAETGPPQGMPPAGTPPAGSTE